MGKWIFLVLKKRKYYCQYEYFKYKQKNTNIPLKDVISWILLYQS